MDESWFVGVKSSIIQTMTHHFYQFTLKTFPSVYLLALFLSFLGVNFFDLILEISCKKFPAEMVRPDTNESWRRTSVHDDEEQEEGDAEQLCRDWRNYGVIIN